MAGIAEGIPGAKAYDEVIEQEQLVKFRNSNKGKPPIKQIIVEPQDTGSFRNSVLKALGIGKNVTSQG